MFDAALPVLDAARCVHARLPQASCLACVDACPRGAWISVETALRFDATACDGCGMCVPACPQQAIHLPMRFAQRTLAESPALLARCEFSAGEDEAGRVPCLHSIGLVDVLRARQRGQAIWLTMRGDCEGCARGQGERLETRIAALNSALAERGLPAILLREVSAATWARLLDALPVQTTAARRGFFGAFGKRPVTALMQNTVAVPDDAIRAPGEWLPASQEGVLPWHIQLDAERCTGCHACARLCPQGAIEHDDSETPDYRLRHARCTGCGLCSDVCQSNAVSPQSWCKAEIDDVPLQTHRCAACGVSFEMPAARGLASLCWVCSRALPVRRLRQIMT